MAKIAIQNGEGMDGRNRRQLLATRNGEISRTGQVCLKTCNDIPHGMKGVDNGCIGDRQNTH